MKSGAEVGWDVRRAKRGVVKPDGGVEGHSAELGSGVDVQGSTARGLRAARGALVTCCPVEGSRRAHGALTCGLGFGIYSIYAKEST